MAYAIVHHFRSGTEEQYETAVKAVHRDDGETLPEGQELHIAGATEDGGWIVVAIHEDKESWEKFRDETLGPGLQNTEGALEGPPDELAFEVRRQRQA
jgi:hypothetical protein